MNPEQHAAAVETIESALTDSMFERQVEMVLTHPTPETYRVASVDGAVTFQRAVGPDQRWSFSKISVSGRDPIANGASDQFVGHTNERAQRYPHRTVNAYPHAYDSIAQFFDSEHAPDLLATHTSSHHFDSHLGQHGSLGVVQARAPFLAAGAGVRADGVVDRSTRTIHVAPTIAALLDLDVHPEAVGPTGERRPDARLRRQDGDPETSILTGERAEHVVVFLLDGCNANLLFDVIDAGEAPHLAGIVARGTAYRHGMFASLPTATLANHTTAVTGAHPGHSGVLHNTWHDRTRSATPDLLSMREMFTAMVHLDPSVETLFSAVHRSRPGAFCTATFEFCDTGADHSSFGEFRSGNIPAMPDFDTIAHVDRESAESSDQYRFMSTIDHTSATQTVDAWRRTAGNPLPALSWCALAITDEAGHESGPHGLAARAAVRDSDARIGDVLAAIEAAGALDSTAIIVIADHGMEQNDPDNTLRWDDTLTTLGIEHLDVGQGMIYLR